MSAGRWCQKNHMKNRLIQNSPIQFSAGLTFDFLLSKKTGSSRLKKEVRRIWYV
jgi:hypothetical protein